MSKEIRNKGFHHVVYACKNGEETRHFYEDLLGMPLVHTEVKNAPDGFFRHLFFQPNLFSVEQFYIIFQQQSFPAEKKIRPTCFLAEQMFGRKVIWPKKYCRPKRIVPAEKNCRWKMFEPKKMIG